MELCHALKVCRDDGEIDKKLQKEPVHSFVLNIGGRTARNEILRKSFCQCNGANITHHIPGTRNRNRQQSEGQKEDNVDDP
jgi:hypothetical protein